MPLIWSYLFRSFLKVFLLSNISFISLLLVMRLKEIARFLALGAGFKSAFWFTLYQIPHILPIAIPISSLISAFLLFHKMSKHDEITALRVAGISLKVLIAPLLLLSMALTSLHFYIGSELATKSKHQLRSLLLTATSSNPFLLMEKQKLLNISLYLEMEKESDELLQNLLVIGKNSSEHLFLCQMDSLSLIGDTLLGKGVSLLTHTGESEAFDTLLIEHQEEMQMPANPLVNMMKKNKFRLNLSSLPLGLLLAKKESHPEKAPLVSHEIARRISLSLTTLTLTLLGFSLGITIRRIKNKKGAFLALLGALFLFGAYLTAKSIKLSLFTTFSLFFLPHLILLFLASYRLYLFSRGRV